VRKWLTKLQQAKTTIAFDLSCIKLVSTRGLINECSELSDSASLPPRKWAWQENQVGSCRRHLIKKAVLKDGDQWARGRWRFMTTMARAKNLKIYEKFSH